MPSCHHAVKDFVVVKTRPKRRFATRHGQQPSSPELLMARRSVSFLLYFVFSSSKRHNYNNNRENNFIYVLFSKKKATTLQNVSQNRWFSHTNAHHGARKHQNIHSTVYTCRFRTIVETEAKQRQIETFLLIVVNLFRPFWKIFLTLYAKRRLGFDKKETAIMQESAESNHKTCMNQH